MRAYLHWRHTGATGIHVLGARRDGSELWAGLGLVLGAGLGIAAPVLALLDVVEPIEFLDRGPVHGLGIVLACCGIAATVAAQAAMGTSWRLGVDASERTELVTESPFSLVRNPIFSALIPTALGLVLLVPSWIAVAGLTALVVGLEIQVRAVEEPHLMRAHGEAFREYASRVGRFVPGVGRLGVQG